MDSPGHRPPVDALLEAVLGIGSELELESALRRIVDGPATARVTQAVDAVRAR